MLFTQEVLQGIAAGQVDLAFRRWRHPTVKVGSHLRTPVGVVEIDRVDVVEPADVTGAEAHRAGFGSADELRRWLASGPGDGDRSCYRIQLHLAGPDPRVALRERADLSTDDVERIHERLQRLDRASRHGPWTHATLELIAARPAVRAGDLAADVGRPRDKFKTDVRKLKELGLTESLGVGYRISPRGTAYLTGVARLRSS